MSKAIDLENGLPAIKTWVESKIPSPADTAPVADGTAAVGTSADYAREDHRHPTDTSRAPNNHASTATTYGAGTSSNYGHVKLSDATNGTAAAASGGTAATPKAVADALAAATGAIPAATTTTPKMDGTAAVGSETKWAKGDHVHPTDTSRAPTSHASSATTYGAGTGSNYGHVKLSDATNGTAAAASGGTAATPKAVADALTSAKSYADGIGADIPSAADATPLMDGTAAVGTSTDYARADHVHPTDTSRAANADFTAPTATAAGTHGLVPAPAQGLTTSILTASGFKTMELFVGTTSSPTIVGGATSLISSDKALYKINQGSSSNYGVVQLSDSTSSTSAAASGYTAATPKAVKDALDAAKTYADGKVTGLYNYKGSVATYAALPDSPETGDVYNVEAAYGDYPAGTNWAWTGSAWDALGGSFTITFATAAEVTAVLNGTT